MKSYVITTGAVFGLVALAHVWRMAEEGAHVTHNPWFLGITALAAGLCLWAVLVLRSATRS